MRHIVKGVEPASFSVWKAAHPGAVYKDLNLLVNRSVKADLKRSLLGEQGYICCYCEREIAENTSHIEHFKPKDSHLPYTHLQLDYANLHACCNLYASSTAPRICGVKKDNVYDARLISPLEPDCASHFVYAYDGSVAPVAGDMRAVYTIRLLGLNSAFLQAMRKAVIDIFLDDDLTSEDVAVMKHDYLQTKANGHLNPFYTTIEQLF